MARVSSARTVPSEQPLLRAEVLRTERLSPHWMRVTLRGAELSAFSPLGYDQWFRLFLPVHGPAGLARVPAKAHTLGGYLKFLRIPESARPVMRSYTVRAFRPDSLELDVDFVLHRDANGQAGPAAEWAEHCQAGEPVLLLDEGITFAPSRGTKHLLLIADETGLPAVAGICGSLPADATGQVLLEAASPEDWLEFEHPVGINVTWLARASSEETPGTRVLRALTETPISPEVHGFIVGEQRLVSAARRRLVEHGVPKEQIDFVGYWKAARHEIR